MPKKTATARGGAQRNRPKVQKNIELVQPASDDQELEVSTPRSAVDPGAASITAVTTPTATKRGESKRSGTTQSEAKTEPAAPVNATKGSAAARLADRRQTIVKAQQRAAASLVTVEHYAYVRRDLIFIAILAGIMFTVIIILRFVPGIGS
ncbi:MAG TPA: hypothetical protein DEV72_17000 [Ktedonobacter sp.]|jgi:hypothetical protein|nr:hypothetical protein [Ktedonobacter sp.]HBE28916.1 hypothetical protein [Ktedonobacter sp.]HCF86883.1 hypothetical protein [Ktedonobacter sp.]